MTPVVFAAHESLYDQLSGSWSRLLDSVSWRVKYGALLGEALPLMSSRRWAVCATHLLASMHCGEKSSGDIDESIAAQTGSVDEVRDLCDKGVNRPLAADAWMWCDTYVSCRPIEVCIQLPTTTTQF